MTVQERNTLIKNIADFVRRDRMQQGDHYASYFATSPDAEMIASDIEYEFMEDEI